MLHDPSAAELCRMLFASLTVALDASREKDGKHKLAASVMSPLLSLNACKLMQQNLTPQDADLWQKLGDGWVIPR